MAANPLDIVSVEQAKTALRLVGDDPAHDELIASHIAGAADWIEERTQKGIVDRPVVEAYGKIGPRDLLVICHRSYAITALGIRDLTDPSAAFIDIADPTDATPGQGSTTYPPPAEGWPFAALAVRYTVTTPAEAVPGDIRSALMMLVRDMYDLRGAARPENWTVNLLLRPHAA